MYQKSGYDDIAQNVFISRLKAIKWRKDGTEITQYVHRHIRKRPGAKGGSNCSDTESAGCLRLSSLATSSDKGILVLLSLVIYHLILGRLGKRGNGLGRANLRTSVTCKLEEKCFLPRY
jgi:hypothetical protein